MSRAAFVIVAMVLAAGCDDTIFGQSGVDAEPPSQTGYAGVQEISKGLCEGCHNSAGQQGGLDLSSDLHLATVGVMGQYGLPLVTAGQPENSMLFLKMSNTHPENTGTDMPPGSGGLSPSLTDVVEQWILDWAPRE